MNYGLDQHGIYQFFIVSLKHEKRRFVMAFIAHNACVK